MTMVDTGARVAFPPSVTDTRVSKERRNAGSDRRKNSRSGRRTSDPRDNWYWRRLAWLFAAYAVYLSVRSLPATMKNYFARTRNPTAG